MTIYHVLGSGIIFLFGYTHQNYYFHLLRTFFSPKFLHAYEHVTALSFFSNK